MKQKKITSLLICLLAISPLWAQDSAPALVSGPMVGYTEMREAMLWVQTNGPADVYFEYSDTVGVTYRTPVFSTRSPEAFIAHLVADQVQPGKTYTYDVYVNGEKVALPYPTRFKTPPLWQFRTDPPAMHIAAGSCVYVNDPRYDRPGKPYGGEYEIFEALAKMQPDMMLWLGDNIYYREADWYSRTGMIHRNTHTRAIKEMQPLLATTANYAIWDDHDYGPNDSDKTYRDKVRAREMFALFWGNPSYGLPGEGGITTTFEWGDAQFFLTDDRYFRDANNRKTGEPRKMLGDSQMDWLKNALVGSINTFKIVCVGGQVLNPVPDFETMAAISPTERQELMDFIFAEGIQNVIFLTGDRHHSEMSFIEKDGIKVYDFTISPLTSGVANYPDEANALRVPGSYVGVRNFGFIDISGPRLARKVAFTLYDSKGKNLWKYEVNAQYPKK